jgi:hypothetical protein
MELILEKSIRSDSLELVFLKGNLKTDHRTFETYSSTI